MATGECGFVVVMWAYDHGANVETFEKPTACHAKDNRIQRHRAIPSARNDLQLNGDCHDDEEAFLFR